MNGALVRSDEVRSVKNLYETRPNKYSTGDDALLTMERAQKLIWRHIPLKKEKVCIFYLVTNPVNDTQYKTPEFKISLDSSFCSLNIHTRDLSFTPRNKNMRRYNMQ